MIARAGAPRHCVAAGRRPPSRQHGHAGEASRPPLRDTLRPLLADPAQIDAVPPATFGRLLQRLAYRRDLPEHPAFVPAVQRYCEHNSEDLTLADTGRALWGCAVLQVPLGDAAKGALASRCAGLLTVGEAPTFAPTCALLWSTACLDVLPPPLLLTLASALASAPDAPASPASAGDQAALRQLAQVDAYLSRVLRRRPALHALLPSQLVDAAAAAWAARGVAAAPSALQVQVHRQLLALGLPAVLEARGGGPGGAVVDIAIQLQHAASAARSSGGSARRKGQRTVRIAVEVDGPTHYTRLPVGGHFGRLGGTVMRDALLVADGWVVVVVPHWEWRNLDGWRQRQQYLCRRLEGAGLGPQTSWGKAGVAGGPV